MASSSTGPSTTSSPTAPPSGSPQLVGGDLPQRRDIEDPYPQPRRDEPRFNRHSRCIQIQSRRTSSLNQKHSSAAAADSPVATLSERVFCLSKESVTKFKARANKEVEEGNGKISSLQAVIADLCRLIIRCRSVPADEAATFGIPIGARQRMSPPLPDEYLGNAVFPGFVTLDAGKVIEKRLRWTAWQVNRMVAAATGEEKVKDFISSWAKEPKFQQFDDIPTNHFILINSPRFDVYSNDFGKGSSFDGRITVSAGLHEGTLDVEVCLLKEALAAMAEDVENNFNNK